MATQFMYAFRNIHSGKRTSKIYNKLTDANAHMSPLIEEIIYFKLVEITEYEEERLREQEKKSISKAKKLKTKLKTNTRSKSLLV